MDWLAEHLDDPDVVVINAGDPRLFERAHIPGAGLVTHMDTLGDDHQLKPAQALAETLARAGARDDARIVLYGPEPMETGWLYMAFAWLGHADHVSMLDGNLRAWRDATHDVSVEPTRAEQGTLTPKVRPDVSVDAAWVREHLGDSDTTLLDVRTEREWDRGYLPGATLVLWQDLYSDLENGRFKSRAEIHALLAGAGAKDGERVVTYCAVGMRASLMYFASTWAGFDTRVYVGSMSDWSQRSGYPIIR
jgi:thiosulfate/3-mercaptopyruvate sulfurtransferase